MEYKDIRLKNKIILVDHAIRIFRQRPDCRNYWVEYLLSNGDLQAMIKLMKERDATGTLLSPLPDKISRTQRVSTIFTNLKLSITRFKNAHSD